jgi:type IV secretory pathway ATPase VirB11/archaellum biosynthesis ATPase
MSFGNYDLSAPDYAKLSNKNQKIYTNDLDNSKEKRKYSPIKLIDFSKGFQINKAALDFLKSIKEEIIIVIVIGKARTGKSYLMNLLLDLIGKQEGFEVASTLQSCTKGIWL